MYCADRTVLYRNNITKTCMLFSAFNELVDAQFKDLKRALVSTGQYRLAESHSQFVVSKMVWANKTDDERNRLFRRFRAYELKNARLVTSTDGSSEVVAPRTKGQKIGQRKRKRTERTTSVPMKKKVSDQYM